MMTDGSCGLDKVILIYMIGIFLGGGVISSLNETLLHVFIKAFYILVQGRSSLIHQIH